MDTVAEISPQPFRDDQVWQIRLCILSLKIQTAVVSNGDQEAMAVQVERSRQGPVDESPTTAVGEAAVAADDGGAAAAVAADGVGLPAELNAQSVPDGSGDTPCSVGNQDGDDDKAISVTTYERGDSVVESDVGDDDIVEKTKLSTRQHKDITPDQQKLQARWEARNEAEQFQPQ